MKCSLAFNLRYLYSIFGLLKLGQVLWTFLTDVCIAHGACLYWCTGTDYNDVKANGQVFVLIVSTCSLLISLLLFFLHFLGCTQGNLRNAPWIKIELVFDIVISVLLLISAILEAYYASGPQLKQYSYAAWKAAAVFCFFALAFYFIDGVLQYKRSDWKVRSLTESFKNRFHEEFKENEENKNDKKEDKLQKKIQTEV